MKLSEIVNNLDSINEETIICMKRPWSIESESIVVELDESLTVPQNIRDAGFDYFLEILVAREVLNVLKDRHASTEDKVRLLLYYAENDAYPDWIY